jgi:curved DNA-binding protein CbpA
LSTTIAPTQLDLVPALAEFAPDQMSAYFLDLEGLLGRVDSATTYYQVLGVDRTDEQEKIKSSFQQLLNLLFPPYVIARTMPAEITPRIERAFNKASQAFAVLASFARRKEYDSALLSIANKPTSAAAPIGSRVSQPKSAGSASAGRADSSAVAADGDHLTLRRMDQRGLVYRESLTAKSDDNRRRVERFKLSIPVRVTGHDRRNGKWHEMAQTIDVSRTGVRLRLRRRVKHGTVLYITLPLPTKLRAHGFAEQSYNVYTLVRRVEPPKQGVRAIGVEFIGEHPPAGFLDKPWAVFRPKRWGGNERRRPNREQQAEKVRIEYFDESMHSISREEARTENVSRYGLRISGTTAPPEFDLVMVSCPRLKFECMAALRNRYRGKDGLERICVQLIGEREWPLRG